MSDPLHSKGSIMAIPRFAHPTASDVRMVPQVVTRPSADKHRLISINPSALFRPYEYRAPRREGLVPHVPKGA